MKPKGVLSRSNCAINIQDRAKLEIIEFDKIIKKEPYFRALDDS